MSIILCVLSTLREGNAVGFNGVIQRIYHDHPWSYFCSSMLLRTETSELLRGSSLESYVTPWVRQRAGRDQIAGCA